MQAEADERRGRGGRDVDWTPLLSGLRSPIRVVLVATAAWLLWRFRR
jgi:hypothetical protein